MAKGYFTLCIDKYADRSREISKDHILQKKMKGFGSSLCEKSNKQLSGVISCFVQSSLESNSQMATTINLSNKKEHV